jgi:hypothetical protein
MTSFKELLFSFFEASRERLKNPAIGTFALSWIAINWRFVAVLFFSDNKLEDRIRIIEECYLNLSLNLWYPLITSGIYLFILPNVMALVDALSRWAISFRKQISNKHKLEDVLAKQEIAVEERSLELIEEGSPDVHKLKEENEVLKLENNKLKHVKETPELLSNSEPTTIEVTEKLPTSKKKKAPKKNNSEKQTKEESAPLPSSKEYPAMRENVIRNVAKSEKEWILLYGFYSGHFGTQEFTRDNILAAYDESKRKTDSRHKNLSNNLNNLVKQGFIRFLNDNEMLLTNTGKELANEILNR